MKVLVKKIISDQFFSATFWVFLSSGLINVGNYAYHLSMGRMLSAAMYGALESVISVFYILSVPTLTLSLVIVKFISSYKGKNEMQEINIFYNYIFRKVMLYGFVLFVLLIALSPVIKTFLHLPSVVLAILLPVTFILNLPQVINRSVLQGYSLFFKFSFLNFLETLFKVVLAIFFVLLGFEAAGAFGAIAIGTLISLIVSFKFLSGLVKLGGNVAGSFAHKKELFKFALPTFITTLSITSLFTTDIILVRHFFPGAESGYYSAISVLGKIIFFASAPIVLVLFPMVSERHSRGEGHRKLLLISLVLTLFISFFITVVYFAIPEIMISILFGSKYLAAVPLLGLFGIFMILHGLCNLLANFYLSIHKTITSYFVGGFALFQIFLLYNFHENLTQVILVSIVTTFLLLISLLLYYPRAKIS